MQNGDYYIPSNLFGLTKDKRGNSIIDEAQAYWVRQIFQLYLAETPIRRIAEFLKENQVITPTGNSN